MTDKEDLKKELEECQKLKEEYLLGWKRERADFINFKKDEASRIERAVERTEEDIIEELLPVLDSIYLAEGVNPEDPCLEGVVKIKEMALNFFKKAGVEEIECLGKEFDPYCHEAVQMVDKPEEKDKIIEVIKRGYVFNGKVLRPAKVKVAK
ncbi:MAG: nucleotide exchange factor GrpE [Candidatus Nealsonbacteria bacterium RIFOXYB1_FULL_40_15]|uniref:Protein GrpE n=2 Tax=Candidatus Nealsoniibacteriota TaxID=1817911 RepID=A0A1G2ERV3_9BACT|nr:MAG: nucleotide exchange factor GrpE [Candidatus Nealsonbacteria bacterium RIFOXYB1_FULL_40_15]OGZ28499.1 MAG: nucleotide exchange factor GrpE [Candidatus Nealsonbacteria bacterium RIFOXYC1_FULL_40_7]OGZ28707.1 MAG: nucleotide exchange factor GrpE [Candidatus Nealsonbacteria bacterium RIFOXYD1_FULL_39_11]